MKVLKYLGGPAIIAALACLCQIVDQLMGGPLGELLFDGTVASGGWIAFIGWACYFLAGADIKGGVKVLVSTLLAIVASVFIIYVGGNLFSALGWWAMPLSVFVFVIPSICTEKIKLNILPVLFVTAGVYFSLAGSVDGSFVGFLTAGVFEVIYILLGCLLGFLTILIRGAYDKKFNGGE